MSEDEEEDRELFLLVVLLILFTLFVSTGKILVMHHDEVQKREAIVNAIHSLKDK